MTQVRRGAAALGDAAAPPHAPPPHARQTTYAAAFVDTVSLFDMGMRPGPSPWPPGSNPGRTHR